MNEENQSITTSLHIIGPSFDIERGQARQMHRDDILLLRDKIHEQSQVID